MGFVNKLFGGEAKAPGGKVNPYNLQDVAARNVAFTDALTAQMNTGMSPALQAGLNQAAKMQGSIANSARGAANPGLAQRIAAQNVGEMSGNAVNQGVMNAQQQLGGQLNTMMGQGLQQNQFNRQLQAGINNANADRSTNLIGGLLQGGANAAAAMSDENAKKNIKNGDAAAKDMLDKVSASTYEYKDPSQPGAGAGTHLSPMAQELEKSEAGASMVVDTPNGKMVDYGKGFGAIMAAQAMLNKRLDALEGKKAASDSEGDKKPKKMAMGGMIGMEANPFIPKTPDMQLTTSSAGSDTGQQMFDSGSSLMSALKGAFGNSPAPTVDKGALSTAPMDSGAVKTRAPMPAAFMASGGQAKVVPGKAKVAGDNLKNDTVPAMLSPGEIVLPRSVVNAKDPASAAAKFVAAIAAKNGSGLKKSKKD